MAGVGRWSHDLSRRLGVVAGETDDVIRGEGVVDERDSSGSTGGGGLVFPSSVCVCVCVCVCV